MGKILDRGRGYVNTLGNLRLQVSLIARRQVQNAPRALSTPSGGSWETISLAPKWPSHCWLGATGLGACVLLSRPPYDRVA